MTKVSSLVVIAKQNIHQLKYKDRTMELSLHLAIALLAVLTIGAVVNIWCATLSSTITSTGLKEATVTIYAIVLIDVFAIAYIAVSA